MMKLEETIGVVQQTPMPSLQQIRAGVQKDMEIDGETHMLTLLVKDALENGMKGKQIQNKYNISRDFIYRICYGTKRPGGPKPNNKKTVNSPSPPHQISL